MKLFKAVSDDSVMLPWSSFKTVFITCLFLCFVLFCFELGLHLSFIAEAIVIHVDKDVNDAIEEVCMSNENGAMVPG